MDNPVPHPVSTSPDFLTEITLSSAPSLAPPHLYHEVLDAAVEGGARVVAHLTQGDEVLTCAGGHVAVQLDVEVTQAGV